MSYEHIENKVETKHYINENTGERSSEKIVYASSNHGSLIDEALRLSDNVYISDIFSDSDDISWVDDISRTGLLSVRFEPDFYSARSKILLDEYTRKNEDETVTKIPVRKLQPKSKFTPHSIYKSLMERMLENHSKTSVTKYPKGRWWIDVGFLIPELPHENADGGSSRIRIGQLVLMLLSLGYDPLLPIRRNGFIKSVNKRMAEIIIESINESRGHGVPKIKPKLQQLASQIEYIVKDYISGGAKPPLDPNTIKNRRWRSSRKKHKIAYSGSRGIEEPLSETSDLEASVFSRVRGESKWLADLARMKRENEQRKNLCKKIAKETSESIWKDHKSRVYEIKKRTDETLNVDEVTDQIESTIIKARMESAINEAELELNRKKNVIVLTDQQKKIADAHKRYEELRLKLNAVVFAYGRPETWTQEIISKHRTLIDSYKEAVSIMKSLSIGDFGK